jgi:hypothetical protein
MPKNWEEVHSWLARGGGDPVTVLCPRCGRRGLVRSDVQGRYVIDWHDEGRGWRWRDDAVTPEELAAPEFGCGYDRRTADGFVGGSPFEGSLR